VGFPPKGINCYFDQNFTRKWFDCSPMMSSSRKLAVCWYRDVGPLSHPTYLVSLHQVTCRHIVVQVIHLSNHAFVRVTFIHSCIHTIINTFMHSYIYTCMLTRCVHNANTYMTAIVTRSLGRPNPPVSPFHSFSSRQS